VTFFPYSVQILEVVRIKQNCLLSYTQAAPQGLCFLSDGMTKTYNFKNHRLLAEKSPFRLASRIACNLQAACRREPYNLVKPQNLILYEQRARRNRALKREWAACCCKSRPCLGFAKVHMSLSRRDQPLLKDFTNIVGLLQCKVVCLSFFFCVLLLNLLAVCWICFAFRGFCQYCR